MATTEISDALTLAELQAEAESRGLAVSGTKAELVERINAYDAEQAGDAEVGTTEEVPPTPPELSSDDYVFSRIYHDGNFDLFQKRGYVIASTMSGPFKFDGVEKTGGVVVVPSDDSTPFVLDSEEFERDYVGVPPAKVIDAPPTPGMSLANQEQGDIKAQLAAKAAEAQAAAEEEAPA